MPAQHVPQPNIIMRTTAMKPYKALDGSLATQRYLAGCAYLMDENSAEVKEWLTKGYAYRANGPMPTEPIVVPPFISSKQPEGENQDERIAKAVTAGVTAALREVFSDSGVLDRIRKMFGGKGNPDGK